MVSSRKLGFFCGDEKVTIVEFDKNLPHQVLSSPLGSKSSTPSPFSSSLTEEIQMTAILQKILQDNKIVGGSFYVSLPMKEIILRSFIIPFVKPDEIQNVIKFEAKKYIPFDIQDLSFVYYAIPFMEDQTKRLQIIFFASRKEVLERYERIFKQVNAEISWCEPYMVSLSKTLLFKKEIKPTDHLAFLILDKNLGRICFIDKGIPQFIREFPIASVSSSEETIESVETLNLKIVNEVGNSFDFYTRQFSGDRIDRMFVSSEFVQQDLLKSLETELKLTLTKFSPVSTAGMGGQDIDMDTIYAMGACVAPPMESVGRFNFLGDKTSKSQLAGDVKAILISYKDVILVFFLCLAALIGVNIFFQTQLKLIQQQLDQLTKKQGSFSFETVDDIQSETKQNADKLNEFKNIRTKSDVVFVLLRVISHLPPGAILNDFNIRYNESDTNTANVGIDIRGFVFEGDPHEQIAEVDQIFTALKNDKKLANYIKKVSLISLNRQQLNDRQGTGFSIHCS